MTLRRLRQLLFGCPICGLRRSHKPYCQLRRVTPAMIEDGRAIQTIRRALEVGE